MLHDMTEIQKLFSKCSKGITAVGDETRQTIIVALMEGPEGGMRVGAITEKTNLSRPAVSHHLKVLRDAEIISVNKKATMNFYYLNPDRTAISNMLRLCQEILEILSACDNDMD